MVADARKLETRAACRTLRSELNPLQPEEDHLLRHRLGASGSFRKLVDCYSPRLLQFFYRLNADRNTAEDLVQDVFLKLIRTSAKYESRGSLAQYIFQVAVNTWIDHYRKTHQHGPLYSLDQPILPGLSEETHADRIEDDRRERPIESVVNREEHERLMKAIQRLTPPHRLAIELVLQKFPYSEIGEMLSIPEGTVKSRVFNAVRALKSMLEPADAAKRRA